MRLHYSARFLKSYASTPLVIQKAFDKQARYLTHNLRHPSLRAKKYDAQRDIWQARVNGEWRFYFTIEGDVYHLVEIQVNHKG